MGVGLGPVVVNGVYDELAGVGVPPVDAAAAAGTTLRKGEAGVLQAAATFRADRTELQAEQMTRLADRLPLAQIRLPFVFTTEIGPTELEGLADRLLAEIEALGDVV